jgi:hypothetical protein
VVDRRWAGAIVVQAVLAGFAGVVVSLPVLGSRHPASTPLDEPRKLHPEGRFAHADTGFPMPESAGPFVRVAVTQHDVEGRHISAGYNALVGDELPLPVVSTVFVYPAPPGADLDAAFDELLTDIGAMHGGAVPLFRKNVVIGERRIVGRYAAFGYDEPWGGITKPVGLRSYVLFYRWGEYWVKWRTTTPGPIDPVRMNAIVALTESLVPPETVPAEEKSPVKKHPKEDA